VGCPIVRQADGLAISSRNVRLSPEERAAAVCLSRALSAGAAAFGAGGDRAAVESAMTAVVVAEPLAVLDYAVLVDAHDLEPADLEPAGDKATGATGTGRPLRLLIAVQIGPVRLIDNLDPRVSRAAG